eukprot:1157775-Pelagomonas_calceolata.AAC.10
MISGLFSWLLPVLSSCCLCLTLLAVQRKPFTYFPFSNWQKQARKNRKVQNSHIHKGLGDALASCMTEEIRLSEAMCASQCVMAATVAANSARHMMLVLTLLVLKGLELHTVGLDNSYTVSERALDACSNLSFTILDVTNAISVRPCPPVRDFEHEGWTILISCKELFLITYARIG